MAKQKQKNMKKVTTEEVKNRIAEEVKGMDHGQDRPMHTAIVILPSSGRTVINYIMSFYFGLTRVVSTTTRPKRPHETEGSEYYFCPPPALEVVEAEESGTAEVPVAEIVEHVECTEHDTDSEVEYVDGTLYTIGNAKYYLTVSELVSKLQLGVELVFSLSAEGTKVLKQILGDDNLSVSHIQLTMEDWKDRVVNKFSTTPLGSLSAVERIEFGMTEYDVLNDRTYLAEVVDTQFHLKNKSDNPLQFAEMVHNATAEKKYKRKLNAA